jgi:hypothetical protein
MAINPTERGVVEARLKQAEALFVEQNRQLRFYYTDSLESIHILSCVDLLSTEIACLKLALRKN